MYVCTYVHVTYLHIIGLPSVNNITVSDNMCSETSVKISWNSPSINNGVCYRGMVLSASSNVMFNTNDTFYTFTNFNESTKYTVRIASVNTLGNGIYNMSTFYIPGQDDFALGGKYICVYVCIRNSCNMGTSDLPDIYARCPRARASADISGKSRVRMLQLLCDTPPSNIL